MFAHLCAKIKYSIEMFELIDFKLPNSQFAIARSDSFDASKIELFPEEIEQLEYRSNPKRRNEFIGVRYLRNQLIINSPILYRQNGSPYFSRHEHALSISHTQDYVALACAQFPIGSDLEQKGRDAAKIIKKFAQEDEKNLCTEGATEWYLQLWCAKEAIYKLVDIENLSFLNEIQICDRQKDADVLNLFAKILKEGHEAEITIQIRETSELYLALAYFKAAP